MQLYAVNFIPLLGSLYMFREPHTPIIRSTMFNCTYSHWYKPLYRHRSSQLLSPSVAWHWHIKYPMQLKLTITVIFSKLHSSQDVVILFQNSTAYLNAMVWSSVVLFACKKQRIALKIFLLSLDCLVVRPKGTRFSVKFF